MPNAEGSSSGNSPRDNGNKQDKDSKDNAKSRPDPRAKDRAEGQSQFDYLQPPGRPASSNWMRSSDATIDDGIEAVGVLGSDVYDKLLVLQALRPLLPNAWFFTTDLDALAAASERADPHPQSSGCFELRFAARVRHPGRDPAIPEWLPDRTNSSRPASRPAARALPNKNWLPPPLLFEIGSARARFNLPFPAPSREKPCNDLPKQIARGTSANPKRLNASEELLRCDEYQSPCIGDGPAGRALHCKDRSPGTWP